MEMLEARFGKIEPAPDGGEGRIKISVAGRPNVGKSSIANRMLGEERMIVSQVAGTTRDSVKLDIDAVSKKGVEMKFRLFDTAGLKLNRKTNSSLDYLSSVRTRKAIGGSDVVFLVLDAMEGVADLDKRLAGEIVEAGAAAIIVVNKWDYAAETFKSAPLRGYENLAAFKKGFEEAVRRAHEGTRRRDDSRDGVRENAQKKRFGVRQISVPEPPCLAVAAAARGVARGDRDSARIQIHWR